MNDMPAFKCFMHTVICLFVCFFALKLNMHFQVCNTCCVRAIMHITFDTVNNVGLVGLDNRGTGYSLV